MQLGFFTQFTIALRSLRCLFQFTISLRSLRCDEIVMNKTGHELPQGAVISSPLFGRMISCFKHSSQFITLANTFFGAQGF